MKRDFSPSRRAWNIALTAAVWAAAVLVIVLTAGVIGLVLIRGIPHITWELLSTAPSVLADRVGILPDILNTVYIVLATVVIVVPLGAGAAVYLNEYASNKKMVSVIEYAAETLSGIPSIVYGLFGMLFFVTQLHWGYSLIAGAFTLAIMVLPVIMRTTEEALIAVPDSYREGSFGLGAGKLRTVFTIVLPSAMPGILSGVILATGRIVGETAALIYTASSVAKIPTSVFSSTRTLAVHMYLLSNEGLYIGQTYGTAVVLLVLVLVINCLSGFLAGKLAKK